MGGDPGDMRSQREGKGTSGVVTFIHWSRLITFLGMKFNDLKVYLARLLHIRRAFDIQDIGVQSRWPEDHQRACKHFLVKFTKYILLYDG